MEKIEKIEVFVNGEKLAAKSRQTIGEFLASLGFKPERCVVEVNLKAKKYADFCEEPLNSGDILYVMSVVAGG